MQKNLMMREKADIDGISHLVFKIKKHSSSSAALTFVILATVALRVLVGYGSYSGFNDPPRYGEFEA
jgi:hypothetical protein